MKYIFNRTHSKLTFGNKIWYNIVVPNRVNSHYSCNTDFEVEVAICSFYGRGGKAENQIRIIS